MVYTILKTKTISKYYVNQTKSDIMQKIVLVDANALAFRSLYSHETLSVEIKNKTVFTGMIFGFLKMLLAVKKDFSPDKFVVFWDGGSHRKKEIFPDYKKDRNIKSKEMNKDDIINSLKNCQRLIKYIGIEQYRIKGEEGDDLIASYIAQNENNKFIILSNDHDFFQLLSKRVKVARMKHGETTIWTRRSFKKEYGFKSKYYPHYLSIVGDSTDKIPGIKGIGEKRGLEIFKQLKKPTLLNIYKNIDNLGLTPVIKKKMIEGKKDAQMFFSIIKLIENLKLIPIDNTKQRPRRLIDMLMALEFRSIYQSEKNMEILDSLV